MHASEISRWISLMDVEIKRSVNKGVIERVRAGLCIHCDKAHRKRGLCDAHYEQFRRSRADKPRGERADWEVEQIRDGKILNGGQAREIRSEKVFV